MDRLASVPQPTRCASSPLLLSLARCDRCGGRICVCMACSNCPVLGCAEPCRHRSALRAVKVHSCSSDGLLRMATGRHPDSFNGACLAFPWAGCRAVGADPAYCADGANSVGKGLADRSGSASLSRCNGFSTGRGRWAGRRVIAGSRLAAHAAEIKKSPCRRADRPPTRH